MIQTIETQIEQLTRHFGLPPVQVIWLQGAPLPGVPDGMAYRDGNRVELYTVPRMPLGDLARHEFAHLVDYHRHPTGRHVRKHPRHDEQFYRILLEVIDAAGASRYQHCWTQEYRLLNAYALRDGYTRQPNTGLQRRYNASEVALQAGVKPGVTVTYQSPRHGRQVGVVVRARYGARVCVKVGTQQFLVPPTWLRVVSTAPAGSGTGYAS